ncbi:U3 small nucleolar RNA-associated protein [Puccinia graminis f. sp. tritici]|uniref:U3 small nucleolar RNA-associated protein n=1 Tax=Puccinia graminis f. sp. tritici TaxID=56615 RepID=A0A5B0S381_PUCGR|nr:U3 small nucleolar RNA-associated protein [Puccinia graminis f. sp. tritici]KAA1131513.1 U3 small nucleolar RNA-associated protein [Puccinia graminis f. sp. tritici]
MAKKQNSPTSTTITNSPCLTDSTQQQQQQQPKTKTETEPKSYPPSITSLPTSQNGSFSYHHQPNQSQSNQQPILHRCRFTDFTPATITAIACSPPTWDSAYHFASSSNQQHPANPHRGLLAVGRGNGDIQLWIWLNEPYQQQQQHQQNKPLHHRKKLNSPTSSPQAWTLYRTLPGHLPSKNGPKNTHSQSSSKVEHLVFTHQFIPSDFEPEDDPQIDHDQIKTMARTPPRLLGTNGADEVLEWEWDGPKAGTIKRTLAMPPSVAIWSLSVSPGSTRLAIGCDDGAIRIANIADNQLELIRKLDPCKTRLLSLSWGILPGYAASSPTGSTNTYPIEPPDSHLFLVAGCADSSLRKWAVSSGRCVNRMTVEKLQGEQTLVWTVAIVNGTIISGDSVGNVHFWDAKSCSRRQTIRAHRADVLCIVASPDGQSVFTSGVDQKTCQLTLNIQQAQKTGAISQSRWLLSASRRLHSHDVRALELSPPYNPLLNSASASTSTTTTSSSSSSLKFMSQDVHGMVPVLISGGLDMSLVLCPAGPPSSSMVSGRVNFNQLPNPVSDSFSVSFADSMQRKISYATQREPVVNLSPLAHLLVCRNSQRISIWHLRSSVSSDPHFFFKAGRQKSAHLLAHDDDDHGDAGEAAWAKVVEMDLKCRTNLITSAISADGRWLAVSDLYEVKVFYLHKVDEVIQPRRVKGFEAFPSEGGKKKGSMSQGARSIEFSADSSRLVLAGSLSSDVVVMSLGFLDGAPQIKLLRVFPHRASPRLVDLVDLQRPVITPSSIIATTPSLENASTSPSSPSSSSSSSGDLDPSGLPHPSNSEFSLVDHSPLSFISKIAISPDGQWLATADSRKTLHIFNLDSMKHHCYLTMPGALVNCLAFPGTMPSMIVVGFATNELEVIDVESRERPSWAVELSHSNQGQMAGLREMRDSMIGIEFGPLGSSSSSSNRHQKTTDVAVGDQPGLPKPLTDHSRPIEGLIWAASWVAKIRLPTTSPSSSSPITPMSSSSSSSSSVLAPSALLPPSTLKRPRDSSSPLPDPLIPSSSSSTTTTTRRSQDRLTVAVSRKYQAVLALGLLDHHQIVIVERPFFDLLNSLPSALHQHQLNHQTHDSQTGLPPVWVRTGAYGT